ncbi:helix-turn-helix domain-containing protein [Anaerobacillus sp. CMMVII]|uniref:helix-turn-helix domain-containing protein n=1 Tax=Anaerobacillus sp. CMMVII TaxID=2755588 RepID=UPI0021B7BE6D|nr:helix-turn-helix domain-containing protein [Anaerobacillus sp. CMMVII]MCT8138845.1 helix-turn-helix domain-containing protein [Anaerobacillus sp. CMMVII]
MDYLQIIFLLILKKFNGNRSVFGAYHILKGKKTAQTVQDCRLFHISTLFGVYKQLERSTALKVVNLLLEKEYLIDAGEQRYIVTKKGEEFLQSRLTEAPLPTYLNGFIYKDITDVFWTRMVLLIQCLSFLKLNRSEFIPVSKDARTQAWVKEKLQSSGMSPSQFADRLFLELETMLKQFSNLEATIFVLRLSGVKRVGLTIDQIAQELKIESFYTRLLYIGVIHGLISKVYDHQDEFPLIYSILDRIETTNLLTETAQKTYACLVRGLNIEEISRLRSLKQNTIEDHLVEICLNYEDFSIDSFVSKEIQTEILAVMSELKTKRLKEIKDKLGHTITYFQIRLILAKRGFLNER